MKYLNTPVIVSINQELLACISPDSNFCSKVECFQFSHEDFTNNKSVSYDRPYIHNSFGQSPSSFTNSLATHASSKHFPALKETLSASFPDFDFSNVCPWHFKLVTAVDSAHSDICWPLMTYVHDSENLQQKLWQAIDHEISTSNSYIYKYDPDGPDPFSEQGVYFNMIMLFLNEKENKVLIVSMREGDDIMSDDDCEVADDNLLESRFGFGVF